MDSVQLRDLLAPILAETGNVLVAAEVRPHGAGVLLQVFIDRTGGVRVADCTAVSRRLNDRLLLQQPDLDYTLEVSSPGLDRRLRGPADAVTAIGRKVRVWTKTPVAERLEHAGELAAVDDTALTLRLADGGSAILPWSALTTARLDPDLWAGSGRKKGHAKR